MLTALNSFAPFERFIDEMVDDVMGKPIGSSLVRPTFAPHADVRANDSELQVCLDVPGLKQEDLELSVENGTLTIKGERKYPGSAEERAWIGRRYGAFESSFALPDYADTEKITASLADGVLTVRVPKHERAKPKKISISVGNAPLEHRQLNEAGG
jgi:HSP20 family protein